MLYISPAAAARITELATQEGDTMLRIAVTSGGCSGFQYTFAFDAMHTPDDQVFQAGNARVVIDQMSLDLIQNATLDFVDEMMGAYFTITNPNAATKCGCGNSFSI